MGGDRLSIVCSLLIVISYHSSYAQQKANQKCAEYFKVPNTLLKLGHAIIGGSLTHSDEFPHMVALGYGPKRNIKWLCGGTLISENHVLTAAHCTNNQEFGPVKMVRMGVRNLNEGGSIDIEIARITKHPNYKPPSQYNDIALLKLKNNIKFSKSALPACLNTVFDVRPRTNKLMATGWGLLDFGGSPSDNLMKVELSLYSHKQCNMKYRNISKRKLSNGIRDTTQMCAGGGPNEEKDTCLGDSGGPLAMRTGPLYTVVGITSFGKACGIPNNPGVYTRVSAYVPWIEKNVWP